MRIKELGLKLLLLFTSLLVTALCIFYSTDSGYFDAFYNRVSSPVQSSLIIGTSRAAQGLVPEQLNKRLALVDSTINLFNFSFTLGNSPYGKNYLSLIKEKINKKTCNGLYIISVDPWCVSSTLDELRAKIPREESNILYKLRNVNSNPNFEYIVRENRRLGFLLLERDKRTFLHKDGWLEINIPLAPNIIAQRTIEKTREYNANRQNFHFSPERYDYLKQTILFLKKHGILVLVRLPVGNELREIEHEYAPDFNNLIEQTSLEMKVPYINLFDSPAAFTFTDGNHLAKPSAIVVSNMLADSLIQILKR